MAAKLRQRVVLCLFSVFFISIIPLFSSQSNSAQNIQTFYPFSLPPVPSIPNSPNNQSIPPSPSPTKPPPPPPPSPPLPPTQTPSNSSTKKAVAKAVVATAASTIFISGLFFFLLLRYTRHRRKKDGTSSHGVEPVVARDEFTRFNGNLKGVIVDEDGLDMLYWRKLERANNNTSFNKEVFNKGTKNEEKEVKRMISIGNRSKKSEPPIQEMPLLRDRSSTSNIQVWPELEDSNQSTKPPSQPFNGIVLKAVEKQNSSTQATRCSSPPSPPPEPPVPKPVLAIPKKQSPAPHAPPPPPIPVKKSLAPPPPPPPKAGGLTSSAKPAAVPKGMPGDNKQGASSSGEGETGNGNGKVKLKPLHWDKVNANVDHSMVWDKIDGGSFRFDGDLMEALFGSVASNRKSPQRNNNSLSPNGGRATPSSQVSILDARKSQNTAIVLRSLAISRQEIIIALMEGQGLSVDTLEKLTKIAPTKEEESEILAFEGDPTRLANAESFLYHLLKAIPSAFTRFNAMFFRSNCDSEILHLKKSIQTLELGCNELRTRGLFLKLLEAILKAGNRMNAGTSRGNAQAFNLTALRKLSDVKSTDGKTTLLRFVVEEVVRSEGKRCVINKNRSLSRNSSQSSNTSSPNLGNAMSNDEREKEYTMLGLPVVGGLSSEFSNVKKAATIDSEGFAKACTALTARVTEIRQLVARCENNGGGFVKEMKGFLEATEEEIVVVKEEQMKVMELVKRTTEYYQAGASNDKGANLLQLFIIVKDFLGMVDQVCIDITRNMQKRRKATGVLGSSSPESSASRISVKFPKLPANFMSDKSKSSSSSDSDEDF